MGYYNPIYIYGVEQFLVDAKAAGVDGLIVVDLPPEEDYRIVPAGAQGRAQFHPAGDADHRRQEIAGGAHEHVGLCLLRLDHRHHRLGRARRRQSRAAVERIKRHTRCRSASASASRTADMRARSRGRRWRRGRLGFGRYSAQASRRGRQGDRRNRGRGCGSCSRAGGGVQARAAYRPRPAATQVEIVPNLFGPLPASPTLRERGVPPSRNRAAHACRLRTLFGRL